MRYSIGLRTRKYVKRYGFLSFARNLSKKYERQLLDTGAKTGLDALKTGSKNVNYKTAEAAGRSIENKIFNKTLKPAENSRSIEEIIIPPEKREEILNELGQVL